MFKLTSSFAAFALVSLAAAPALAQSPVTFVSGKGTDAGNCAAPATPCRTFQFALGRTNAGGEIKALDPANYFAVFINKSINITGVDGAGILKGAAGDAVTITAGANGVVSLSNLIIDGVNRAATNGIALNSAASLTIRNCAVRNFSVDGIRLYPTTELKFLIADVAVTDNGNWGVAVGPPASPASGALNHVVAARNGGGIIVSSPFGPQVFMTLIDSEATDNTSYGFYVGDFSNASLYLNHSTATRNNVGVFVDPDSTGRSAGNNFITGNISSDVSGTLTNVGTK